MSNLLLLDQVLSWLEPYELQEVKQVNKECYSTISSFIQSNTHYTLYSNCVLHWRIRDRLYKEYPNIQSLTLYLSYRNLLVEYLRPTIKSLEIVIPIEITQETRSAKYAYWLSNTGEIIRTLQDIHEYLESTPTAQLAELTLRFNPVSSVTFVCPNALIVEYDRHGPIYEDDEHTVNVKSITPSELLSIVDPYELKKIEVALENVVKKENWKKITIPYHFPGAQGIPNVTYTDKCVIDKASHQSIEEKIGKLM